MSDPTKNTPPVTDYTYLAKLKQARLTEEQIARKMGKSVEEIRVMWATIIRTAEQPENGLLTMRETCQSMIDTYRQLGILMGSFMAGANNVASDEEIRDVITKCPTGMELAPFLAKHLIIVKPFTPISLEEELKRIDGLQSKN